MTIKVKYHFDNYGRGLTTFKAVNQDEFYNRLDDSGWFTTYPSGLFRESCSPAKNEFIFEVVDGNGNVLFTESNAGLGAFVSIRNKTIQVAQDFAARLKLRPYEDWRQWLREDKPASGYMGNLDNWLFAESQNVKGNPIEEYSHLGLAFVVSAEEYAHTISNKKWVEVQVLNKKADVCEEICGYVY